MNRAESAPEGTNAQKGMTGASAAPAYAQSDRLEEEDIIILCLSVILVVATAWLAVSVL
jgi:hypothetical protein